MRVGRKGKARPQRGKEWIGKGVCIHGCPTVPYGVDVAGWAGGVVLRGQIHGAEDLVCGGYREGEGEREREGEKKDEKWKEVEKEKEKKEMAG